MHNRQRQSLTRMLFFELFPAFLMIISVIIGVALYLANARADEEGEGD